VETNKAPARGAATGLRLPCTRAGSSTRSMNRTPHPVSLPSDGRGWRSRARGQGAGPRHARRLKLVFGAGALLVLLPGVAWADDAHTGLWVGTVAVEKVNRPGKPGGSWDPEALLPAANPFTFRFLAHVDTNGQARLLQRVLAAWNPRGDVVTNQVTGQVTTNGYYALLTVESQAASYTASQPSSKVYRISSVNFPLMGPQDMTGVFGGTNSLTFTVNLPYDDPVNPFVHVYAPLHDNSVMQNSVKTKLPEGEESYSLSRGLTFNFVAQDPDSPPNPRWGISEVGGEYRELVTGLYQAIRVQGRFRLQRFTTIGRLEQ